MSTVISIAGVIDGTCDDLAAVTIAPDHETQKVGRLHFLPEDISLVQQNAQQGCRLSFIQPDVLVSVEWGRNISGNTAYVEEMAVEKKDLVITTKDLIYVIN